MTNQPPPIRSLAGLPDYGRGTLGQLAHAVLLDYADAPPDGPQLHLGQNTMPDPPFPLPAALHFADLTKKWPRHARDLPGLLGKVARSVRAQPLPGEDAVSSRHRQLQQLMRYDSIAIVLPSRAISSAASSAARHRTVTWVVDRAGSCLAGAATPGAGAGGISVGAPREPDGPVIGQLAKILAAQYSWTCAVFGPAAAPGSPGAAMQPRLAV